ncbi:hypothetical protein KEM60_01327 [Austwickia sp. TVS 96-490-7B]|uniref:DUF4440 domain-containing protein n=1 Tax=Austwickia sp. TVS 96-490-7B TaxID=2830843 RepID=UPI001C5995DA|nr:DUF4440 domain-containing protein [Austwickia sp. TVS 96-490-7B]MBW3085131.1 hypothetical protein [Austwickia sp. TVS 96-490-7B]
MQQHDPQQGTADSAVKTPSAKPTGRDGGGARIAGAVRGVLPGQSAAAESLTADPYVAPSVKISPLALAAEGYPVPTEAEIAALFDRWNSVMQNSDAKAVDALYMPDATLLPSLSEHLCENAEERLAYYEMFLAKKPWVSVIERHIYRGHGMAVDVGRYRLEFQEEVERLEGRYSFAYVWNGEEWAIVSHHSSFEPDLTMEEAEEESA